MANSLLDLMDARKAAAAAAAPDDESPITPTERANVANALNAEEDDQPPMRFDGTRFVPAAKPVTEASAVPIPPGDQIMDQGRKVAGFSDQQQETAGFIKNSLDLVFQRADEDPAYDQHAVSQLRGLTGEAYAQKAIDLADDIKIDYLKKTFPDRFNGPQAAMTAMLNEATFGQMTRMIGGAGAVINGQPYDEVVKQKAEEFRLLSKAYPGLDLAGKAAAFLIPGSPVKALFEGGAALGAKGAGEIIKRVVKNPALLSKAVKSAAGGAAGAGVAGAVQGYLGHDLQQPFSLDRAVDQGTRDAEVGGALGAMAPLLGAGISKGIDTAAPYVQRAGKGASRVVGKVVSGLSSTPAAALRAYNRSASAMRSAFGTEKEIGEDLVDFVLSRKRSKIEELDVADGLLDQLPDVSPQGLIGYLRSFGKGVNIENDPAVKRLHEWADRIESRLPADPAAAESVARKRAIFNSVIENKSRAIGQAEQQLEQSVTRKRAMLNSTAENQGRAFNAQVEAKGRVIAQAEERLQKAMERKRAILNATAENQGRAHAGRVASEEANQLTPLGDDAKKTAVVGTLKKAARGLEEQRAEAMKEIAAYEAEGRAAIDAQKADLEKLTKGNSQGAQRAQQMKDIAAHEAEGRKALEAQRAELEKFTQAEKGRIDEIAKRTRANPAQKITARAMRHFVDELQDAAADQYGRESNMYKTAVKQASRRARMTIVEAAQGAGTDAGKLYVQSMAKAAEKVQILKFIKKQLGSTPEMMAMRSQGFIDRLLGKNKGFLQSRMADLDTKFGTNFMERASMAQKAEQLGPGGMPSYFPNINTGRSLLGSHIGEAVGTIAGAAGGFVGGKMAGESLAGAGIGATGGKMLGKAVGTAVSSPKLGALLMGSSDSVTGFVRRMVAKPEVIARLAGQIAKKPATDAGNRQLARLSVPWEVRRIAQEIQNTLVKDGPRSAAGVVRLVADTPYFLGLVHYFDLMEQRSQRNDIRGGIQSLQTK